MWSFGHLTLRLPYDFEDHYTFAEYDLLVDRWHESGSHAEYRASLIAAMICNVNRSKESQPIEYDHFMRHPFKKQPTEIAEISPALMHEKLKYAFGAPDPDPVEQPGAGGVS